MTLNLPYKVRAILYIFTAVGSPIVAYMLAKNMIGELEVGLWSAEVTVVTTLAAFNVSDKSK